MGKKKDIEQIYLSEITSAKDAKKQTMDAFRLAHMAELSIVDSTIRNKIECGKFSAYISLEELGIAPNDAVKKATEISDMIRYLRLCGYECQLHQVPYDGDDLEFEGMESLFLGIDWGLGIIRN